MVLSTAAKSDEMPEHSETERRLTEVSDKLDKLDRKFDRLLIGNGSEGALGRLTKLEQRQSFIHTCYLWLAGGFAWLAWMVIPDYFSNHK